MDLKKVPILFILLQFSSEVFAQNKNEVWIFGDSAGIDFTSIPIVLNSGMDGRGSCVSLSDSFGNLTFYAFTKASTNDWSTKILNFNHEFIQGADSITGAAWYNELTIIPQVSSNNEYYLFSIGSDNPNNDGLYYTLIDMSANGGHGIVIQENIQVDSGRMGDCLTAVKHANGRDWWIISKFSDQTLSSNFNRFFEYLVTPDSIYDPIVQDFNDAKDVDFQKLVFKTSGDTFMMINLRGYMSEFNFDRCAGIITPIRTIYPELLNHRYFWEGAYSPNGNVFYVSTNETSLIPTGYLIQYDLTASDIPASADTLDSFQAPIGTGAVRLAPDGKIYFTRAYECNAFPYCYPYPDSVRNYVNENLSVINDPDVIGSGCNYQPFSFYLGGKRTYYGLPNNPNYDLGPVVGSACDSLFNGMNGLAIEKELFQIYPNPFEDEITIHSLYPVKGKFIIQNEFGEMLFEEPFNGNKTFNLSFLSEGIYIVCVVTDKNIFKDKFIKIK